MTVALKPCWVVPRCTLQSHSVSSSTESFAPSTGGISLILSQHHPALCHHLPIKLFPSDSGPVFCAPRVGPGGDEHGLYLHVGVRRRMSVLGLTRVHCEAVGKSPAFTESHSQIRMVRDRQFVLQCEPKPHTQDREASQNFLSKGEPEPHRGHAQTEGPWRLRGEMGLCHE